MKPDIKFLLSKIVLFEGVEWAISSVYDYIYISIGMLTGGEDRKELTNISTDSLWKSGYIQT